LFGALGQLGIGRNDAELDLSGQRLFTDLVPGGSGFGRISSACCACADGTAPTTPDSATSEVVLSSSGA